MTPDRGRRPLHRRQLEDVGHAARRPRDYCERLLGAAARRAASRHAEVAVCAPFTALDVCAEKRAGQRRDACSRRTCTRSTTGAFTGEVSARDARGARRGRRGARPLRAAPVFGETDRALQEKVPAALAAGLRPILCVGETEEERERGETERKLRHQVQEGARAACRTSAWPRW